MSSSVRVGMFVFAAITVIGITAFVLGNQRNIFESKTRYSAVFEDVDGLRPGSEVTLSGVSVGTVQEVAIIGGGEIRVTFSVLDRVKGMIRGTPDGPHPQSIPENQPRGSYVELGSRGMLGDKVVVIRPGSPDLDEWPAERALPVDTAEGLFAMADDIARDARGVAENLRLATDPLSDQAFTRDVQTTARNLARISEMLAEGDGTIQRLMTDENTAEDVGATLRQLRTTSAELARAARGVRAITDEIANGDGTAHRLIYGDEGADAVASIGRASDEAATALAAIREGEGGAHALIYGEEGAGIVEDLASAADDVAAITADVRAGRGTIGGLLIDPSIYEDVKRLVGDLSRNEILRSLVRYSIRRDDEREESRPEASE